MRVVVRKVAIQRPSGTTVALSSRPAGERGNEGGGRGLVAGGCVGYCGGGIGRGWSSLGQGPLGWGWLVPSSHPEVASWGSTTHSLTPSFILRCRWGEVELGSKVVEGWESGRVALGGAPRGSTCGLVSRILRTDYTLGGIGHAGGGCHRIRSVQ